MGANLGQGLVPNRDYHLTFTLTYSIITPMLFDKEHQIEERGEVEPLKNQTWETGEERFMCPILSLLTLDVVTSTPHLSQITPLCLILLYFPQ